MGSCFSSCYCSRPSSVELPPRSRCSDPQRSLPSEGSCVSLVCANSVCSTRICTLLLEHGAPHTILPWLTAWLRAPSAPGRAGALQLDAPLRGAPEAAGGRADTAPVQGLFRGHRADNLADTPLALTCWLVTRGSLYPGLLCTLLCKLALFELKFYTNLTVPKNSF